MAWLSVTGEIAKSVPPQLRWLTEFGVPDWSKVDLAIAIGAFTLFMSTIIVFLPMTLLAVRFIHLRSWISVLTGRARFRWRLFGTSLAISVGIAGIMIAASIMAFPERFDTRTPISTYLAFLPFYLLLIPPQVAAEEVFFRGYLMQAVGHVTPLAWVRLLVPAVLFFALHLPNREVIEGGLPALLYFALISAYLGWLALRGNGLEIAIGLHAGINFAGIAVVTTSHASIRAPGIFHLLVPNYWEDLIGIAIFCALHWLIIRRVLRRERSASDSRPIANLPGRA